MHSVVEESLFPALTEHVTTLKRNTAASISRALHRMETRGLSDVITDSLS